MLSDFSSEPSILPFSQQIWEHFSPELRWSQDMIIGILIRGNLSISFENTIRSYSTHDIFFFMPFETYSVINSDADAKVLCLNINSDFIQKMVSNTEPLHFRQHHISHDLRNTVYYNLCCDFSTIIFNNLKNDTCAKFRMLGAVTNILITLFENYGVKAENDITHDYATNRIINILNFINEHYTEKLTVKDISNYLGIHPQYFSAFFTKHFHTGFIEYLTAFRINASLNALIYSNKSILELALENGFTNHKTYAAAFRKLYHQSPTAYRKNKSPVSFDDFNSSISNDSGSDNEYKLLAYFRQFLNEDNHAVFSNERNFIEKQQTLNFNPEQLSRHSFYRSPLHFFSAGRAFACLRTDLQQQIIQANKDLKIDYLRIRDIFSDALYVYYETDDKKPMFNFQALDNVFDFILSQGIKPFPEIGYMPEKLAAKKQYAGLQFHPNVSAPKSPENWKALIRSFLSHCIDRYGIKEVSTWYFDFWTAPDLNLKMSYWNESMTSFFDFYHATYNVFQEISPRLRLGTPNFSTIFGYPWYEAFFEYCHAHKIDPAYISFHVYGCIHTHDTMSSRDFNTINSNDFSIMNQNQVYEFLEKLHHIMAKHSFSHKEIIASDYNLNFMPRDLIRDTCYMGPYIAHTTFQTMKQVKGLCYWCLSDIHEDAYHSGNLFWGGPGLLDYHGLKKASYNTLVLLGRLGDKVLEYGKNYMLSQKGDVYQLFLYNLVEFDNLYSHMDQSMLDNTHRYNIFSNDESINFNIVLQLPKGTYYVKKMEVNRNYGSAYDIWGQMDYPENLSKEIEDYLRDSSIPHVSYTVQEVNTSLILDETIPAHGLLLLEIQKK